MEISAANVMALRQKTGLSMMECKQALVEAQGNEEKAIEILRKKGFAAAGKRASHETGQGRIGCFVDAAAGRAGIVELRCETAPVANTEDFIGLATLVARHAADIDDPTPDQMGALKLADDPKRTLGDRIHDVFNRVRENIRIARIGSLRGHLGHYVHHNGQVGVVVEFSGDCPAELRTDVCMHVAAMRPMCTRREQVDPELVAREREFAAEQIKDKPANMIPKIVDGKLNRWYSEIVLLEQMFVKDDKKSVQQVLAAAGKGLTVTRFLRFEVGGS